MLRALPFFAAALLCSADIHDALAPVTPNHAPGPEYAGSTRQFQGIPGLERAPNGRLWAVWYAGGPDEPTEGPGNYVVVVTSNDDGRTWSGPRLVIDPPGDVRAYDPTLWHDPEGRLWLFWAQSSHKWDGRSGVWAMRTANSGDGRPRWSAPRRLCHGIMMNKPTVLKNGDWLLPVSVWAQKPGEGTRPQHRQDLGELVGANVFLSRDKGKTFSHLGQTRAADSIFDEHSIVERRDGSLWMLLRTRSGIAESVSTDGGKTWTPALPSSIPHVSARFFIRRLQSGNLLLVRHNPPELNKRSHLTAYLSTDDGRTWSDGMIIDERVGVSYPDGVQDPQGNIRIVYDFERTRSKMILMAVFTEDDVRRGSPSASARLRVLVNQAAAVDNSAARYCSPPPLASPPGSRSAAGCSRSEAYSAHRLQQGGTSPPLHAAFVSAGYRWMTRSQRIGEAGRRPRRRAVERKLLHRRDCRDGRLLFERVEKGGCGRSTLRS